MGYEINVSLNGKNFFATHERSITNIWKLQEVLPIFMEKFPEAEGYKITVTEWQKTGKHMDIEEIMSKKWRF